MRVYQTRSDSGARSEPEAFFYLFRKWGLPGYQIVATFFYFNVLCYWNSSRLRVIVEVIWGPFGNSLDRLDLYFAPLPTRNDRLFVHWTFLLRCHVSKVFASEKFEAQSSGLHKAFKHGISICSGISNRKDVPYITLKKFPINPLKNLIFGSRSFKNLPVL